MRTVNGKNIEPLDGKQRNQLLKLSTEFQPHAKVEGVAFIEVINAARAFCDRSYYPFYREKKDRYNRLFIEKLIAPIKGKYYFNEIKYRGTGLSEGQYAKVRNMSNAPKVRLPEFGCAYLRHDASERELFMKIVRACRDYMRAKMSKEAEQELYEKLSVVWQA